MKIFENYDIKRESTFKIGSTAARAAFPQTLEELVSLLKSGEYDIILGSCSNVLFSSEPINKKIIITKNIKGYSFNGNKLRVECGVKGPVISKECENRALCGFEFLIGFPGSFGGMICMNASAHNQSVSDRFISARVYDLETGKIIKFSKAEMKFEYRKSGISNNRYIVLDADFELEYGDAEKIKEIMNRNIEFRKNRQPSLTYGSAGSIFKNPPNDSAGRLLDLCNMKGIKQGGAMVFENHANFILNYDNASSLDVLTLMYKMYSNVKEKYTIELVPEIKYIGDKGTKEYKLWERMTKSTTLIQE